MISCKGVQRARPSILIHSNSCFTKISRLVVENPEISELDLNPLFSIRTVM